MVGLEQSRHLQNHLLVTNSICIYSYLLLVALVVRPIFLGSSQRQPLVTMGSMSTVMCPEEDFLFDEACCISGGGEHLSAGSTSEAVEAGLLSF